MVGLILAVALLLAVLSVMNGFEREMRERILALVPHVTVRGFTPIEEWAQRSSDIAALSGVQSVQPFVEADALLMRGRSVEATRLLGIGATSADRFSSLVTPGGAELFADGGIILGAALARRLNVEAGSGLTLLVPTGGNPVSPASAQPRRLTVNGLLNSGTELDERLVLADIDVVADLAGIETGVSGLSIQLDDLFAAPAVRWQLSRELDATLYVSDWTLTQGNLYAAIRLSRNLISILLLSIVAVAAFNVVSSLVLVVTDRRYSIAILSAMGATSRDIGWIFLIQGAIIGSLGAGIGTLAGLAMAYSAPGLARALEWALGVKLLNTDVYPLNFLPVDIRIGDVGLVFCASIILCLAAAVLPALRAAKLPVAATLASAG